MLRSVDTGRRAHGGAGAGSALRTLREERGAAMVEMALVLPILVFLVVGMLEFGRGINYWLDVNHLASEGARIESVGNPSSLDLAAYLSGQATTSELKNGGTDSVPDPLQVSVCVGGAGHVGDPVTVTVKSSYHWLPLATLFGDPAWGDTTIEGSATMRLEAPLTAAACP